MRNEGVNENVNKKSRDIWMERPHERAITSWLCLSKNLFSLCETTSRTKDATNKRPIVNLTYLSRTFGTFDFGCAKNSTNTLKQFWKKLPKETCGASYFPRFSTKPAKHARTAEREVKPVRRRDWPGWSHRGREDRPRSGGHPRRRDVV